MKLFFYRTQVRSLPCLVRRSVFGCDKVVVYFSWSCYMDLSKVYRWISLTCYVDLSKLLHGSVKVCWPRFQSLLKLLLWTKKKLLNKSKYSMPWVRCAFGHVYLYQSMICSVVSPLPILNSRMLLPWSDYCSRTKSKNPFRARGTFVLQGTFDWTLWRSGVCNEMRWWWDSLVDKGPHCLCWSCWTADEQLGRSPAGRGKVRVGCDKNICICICICICWIDEQDERSTPQSWKKGHKWLAGCDKKSGTLLSPFWWKVPPTTTFHLLCVTKNFGVHLLCLWWMWGDV